MPAGQAFLDILANAAIVFDPAATPPFIVDEPRLRALSAPERSAMAASGMATRRDEGVMALSPIGGGAVQNIPAIVVLGSDGPPGGGNGVSAGMTEPARPGAILIVVAGNGTPSTTSRADGGGALCAGAGGDGLVVALGGHGATGGVPAAPGGNGQDGGHGGQAVAIAFMDGAVVFAHGGDGQALSYGGPGAAGVRLLIFWGPWIAPPIPPGADGNFDGSGGYTWAIGGNDSRLLAYGGAASPTTPPPPPMGPAGLGPAGPPNFPSPGRATVVHGLRCQVTAKNGDGTPGAVKQRP